MVSKNSFLNQFKKYTYLKLIYVFIYLIVKLMVSTILQTGRLSTQVKKIKLPLKQIPPSEKYRLVN